MRNNYPERKRDDCPNCKTKEGAIMSSSEWNHGIICCSDSCGEAISKKIEINTSSKEYQKAIDVMEKAKDKARSIKYKGTGVGYDPFSHINGSI